MELKIHPSAAENYDKMADALVDLVEECPPAQPRPLRFPMDRPATVTITHDQILGDISLGSCDYRGKTVERYFPVKEKCFGLKEEDYKGVVEIVERLREKTDVRRKLSYSFIESTLFIWVSERFLGTTIPNSFVEYLNTKAQSEIESITSWVPIANLEIEESFPVSSSEIRPISSSVIDTWASKMPTLIGQQVNNASILIKQLREDFQGLAAVVTVTEAESECAMDFAIKEAQRITSVLGIFSSAAFIPDVKSVSRIKGSESVSVASAILECREDAIERKSILLDRASAKPWRLDRNDIHKLRNSGLDRISALLAAESLNGFEEAVLNAILLYSKSTLTADPVEKVVYMLSAMESIVLRNQSEAIQQNLAERVALFSSHKLEERKSIIKTMKSAYKIRSLYLHHGHTSAELKLVAEFMMCVAVFFRSLIANVGKFDSKEEFLDAIDDHKLA